MIKYSGLQRQVLSLYRNCLRECRKKPVVSGPATNVSSSWLTLLAECKTAFRGLRKVSHLNGGILLKYPPCSFMKQMLKLCWYRSEFRKNTAFDKKDFGAIEFLLRKGQRQLQTYSAPGIKDIR